MIMVRFSKVLALAILSSVLVASSSAHAQNCGGLGLSYLFGYGAGNSGLFGAPTYNNMTPPYFALHPPVYYGQRYSMPYGLSPFAAWPQLQPTPGFHGRPYADRAQMLSNPHHVPCVNRAPSTNNSIVANQPAAPLVIDNPFFKPEVAQLTSAAKANGN